MARVVIEYGIKVYRNDQGDWHRDDGPAVIYPDGTRLYFNNGIRIRPFYEGPTDYRNNGIVIWRYKDRIKSARPNGFNIETNESKIVWPTHL